MKRVNALELRHSLSKIIALLQKTGEPVLLEKGRRPAAVLISLHDFQTRFVEKEAELKRQALLQTIQEMSRSSPSQTRVEKLLRELRYGNE